MRRHQLVLAALFLLQTRCSNAPTQAASNPSNSSAPMESQAAATATLPAPTATAPPTLEPTIAPPPSISPESFGKATVLHDYWPAVRKAGKFAETMRFGTSETAWALSPDGRYVAVAGCDVEAGQGESSQSFLTFCEHTIYDSTSHAFLFILDAKTEELVASLPEPDRH